LCRASDVSADIDPGAVPIISYEIHELVNLGCVPQGTRDNFNATTVLVDWARTNETGQILLTDAQTSGGLLLCVAEADLQKALKVLRKARTSSAAVIGRIVPRRRRRPLICMTE
jgi:selenide,water dikinase